MTVWHFVIPGTPTAWQRARRNGRRYFDGQEKDKLKIAAFAKHAGIAPVRGHLILTLGFYFNRPKKLGRAYGAGAVPMGCRPDVDNLIKIIGDGLNGVAWFDDAQIWEVRARKWYHELNGSARTEIHISDAVGKI